MKVKIEKNVVETDNVKRIGVISTAKEDGVEYHSVNIWFKNGKMKFIQTVNYTKLLEFVNKVNFALHKSEIIKDLQGSF